MSYSSIGAAGPTDENVAREMYAAAVSASVDDWRRTIDAALNGSLSVTSVLSRGIIFIPNVAQARQRMLDARKMLVDQFLPAAVNAIRDYSRDIGEVKDSIDGFMSNMRASFGIEIDLAKNQSITSVVNQLRKTPPPVPWYVYAGVGLGGLAVVGYFFRSIR